MQLNGLPFPGREREQAVLASVVTDLEAGRPAVVTVSGRPGFGQGPLLRWTAELAEERGLRVLRAQATLGESRLRYGVVEQLLTTMDGLTDSSLGALAEPERDDRLPGLAELLRSARDRPTLVVVDEVEWLDPDSRRWFGALVRRLPGMPVSLLASSSGVSHWGWCGGDPFPGPVPSRQLALSAFTLRDVATLVTTVCGTSGQEPFNAAACEISAGNPMVLHEALRQFTALGWVPVAERVPELRALIEAICGEYVARALSGLSDTAVAVVRALAVCGELLDLPQLYALAGPRAASEPGLGAALEASGLATASDTGMRLCCPEARKWILEEMTAAERAELHARAAELAHRAALPDEDIARLLLDARPLGEPWAIHVLRRTCAAMLRAGRPDRAIACLSRALEEPLDPAERAQLGLELGAIEVLTAPEASDRRLAEIVRSGGDAPARARVRAADLGLTRGGVESLRSAVAHALPTAHGAEREALAGLFRLTERGRPDDADLLLPEIPPLPARPTDPAQAAARARQLALHGEDLPTARALARLAFTGEPGSDVLILPRITAGRILLLTDDLDEAEARLDALHVDLRRRNARAAAALVLAVRGELNLRQGRLDAAERDVAAAGRALPHTHWHPYHVSYLTGLRITVALDGGRVDEARELADAPAPVGARDSVSFGHLLFARAMVASRDGRLPEALELFRACGRRLLRHDRANPALMPWRSMAAGVCHALGDHEEAQRLSREEIALARRWGAAGTLGVALLGAGRVAREARAHRLREAVHSLRPTAARLAYAGALIDLATTELDAGNRQAAAPLVAELFTFTTTHRPSSRLAGRVRTLAERLGQSAAPGPGPHPAWATLTEPERRTATLAGLGHGNREIAEMLSVTRRTVELRLSGAYRKLRIGGRAELHALVRATEGYGTDVA
ncbi:AAA family ATPase [Streptomyces sp. Rer75]|uniref:AAA family ATPase n=1 Tax=Streptomyces sp. Rer75 TaxID=2750011 RepID=UPI0015CF8B80|nr:LuxR family transcriptional regulator [Streptomyces sp. Rer75]QLH26300.1 AAA family ATPase [Streptomyces sp. Rer75]